MLVKIFSSLNSDNLEKQINTWMEKTDGYAEIIDLRMSNCSDGSCGNTQYNVIILYK